MHEALLVVDQSHQKFMQYEGTLFWHFQGACYGEAGWVQDKANADQWISTGGHDGKKKKKKGRDEPKAIPRLQPPPVQPSQPVQPVPLFLPGRKSWIDTEGS